MSGTEDEVVVRAQARLGTVLRGKYRLDSVLGFGGMAVVYAATHRNNKRFAVKLLRPEVSLDPETCRRFVREGYVANTVGHDGAVVVLDDDVTEDGVAFLVMELLDGQTVEALIESAQQRGEALPVATVLTMMHALLAVLAAAHAKGIVHRDIKPANLFITRAGQLKVLDFGIARLRDDRPGATTTQTGAVYGSPAFMSPEQARGKASLVAAGTDLWAVGASMFHLLSGAFVHVGETVQEVLIRCATIPARSMATVAPHVPLPVAAIVDRALAFDPSERWTSGAEMRDAIAAAHRELCGLDVPALVLVEHDAPASRVSIVSADETSGRVVVVPGPLSAPRVTALGVTALQHEITPMGLPRAEPTDAARRRRVMVAMAASAVGIALLGGAVVALRGPRIHPSSQGVASEATEPSPLPGVSATPSASAALVPQASASAPTPGASVSAAVTTVAAPVTPHSRGTKPGLVPVTSSRPKAPSPEDFNRQ